MDSSLLVAEPYMRELYLARAIDILQGSSLKGIWPFWDLSGTNIRDYSPLLNNGTPSTDVFTWATPPAALGLGVRYDFDGANNYINLGDDADFEFAPNNPFSVGAWVYQDGNAAPMTIISKHNGWGGGTRNGMVAGCSRSRRNMAYPCI